jgi:L-amino acid N-acyltransferase YncA
MNNSLIRLYTPNDWRHVVPLIEVWPFKPLAQLNGFRRSNLIDFTCERVLKALSNENCGACIAMQVNDVRGFACFNMLPWDSEQLGVPAARIDYLVAEGSYHEQRRIKEGLLERLLAQIEACGVRHLSVRIDASDNSSLHALEAAGFNTIDTILTFAIDLTKQPSLEPDHDFKIRLANASDAEQVAALARTAFVYDRFHSDPSISRERADELHATWLRDSCNGKAVDAVLLAEDEGGLLGFASCVVQRDTRKLGRLVGTIILAASAERARGRGVAHATMMAATEWMRQQGCEVVEGGTQVRNIPSARLFRRCGFVMVGASVSLRKLCSTNVSLY